MKINKFILITVLSSFLFYFNSSNSIKQNSSQKLDSLVTITLSFVGDLMCHSPQFEYARINKDSFDFKPVFNYIQSDLISSSDLTAANLETVLAGKENKFSGYPFFNSPDEFLVGIKEAGFSFLFTSNNHSLDRGEEGITRTISQLEKNLINHTGTFISQKDRDSLRIVDINGIKLAIFSYSYGTNGNRIPWGKEYLINLIDTLLIKKNIIDARTNNADLVLCYFHFGEEYQRTPSKWQKEIVDKTVSYGADLIIGSHPHVIQSIKFIKNTGSKLDSSLIAYSLGNFLSNQRKRYRDAGIILKIVLKKNLNNNKIYYDNVNCIPTWVYKGLKENKKEYLILKSGLSDTTYKFLSNYDLLLMKQSFNDTKEKINNSFILINSQK
jgi:poly-gamma-glutamate capsule biosynthesis protein CapA/YwtB (metallophosphatase superfamily)